MHKFSCLFPHGIGMNQDLITALEKFLQQRHWKKFHTPKNLAMSIAIEAAEIMELFQWMSEQESIDALKHDEFVHALQNEIADVFIYMTSLASQAGIDMLDAALAKMKRNETRFPPAKSNIDGLQSKIDWVLNK